MILVDSQVIDLDKPLCQYLKKPIAECPDWNEFKEDERHKKITARMALSHATGFPNLRIFMPDKKLAIMFDPGSRVTHFIIAVFAFRLFTFDVLILQQVCRRIREG